MVFGYISDKYGRLVCNTYIINNYTDAEIENITGRKNFNGKIENTTWFIQ